MSDISKITLPSGDIYDLKDVEARQAIPFGIVNSTSTATAFTATVPGITELKDGVCVMLKNGVVTSTTNFTININGLGAKPVYTNLAAATRDTTIFNINYTMLFVYDSTRVSGGGWICYRGYDANTNTIGYQLRTNSTVMNVSDTARYYKLYFTSADGTMWVPASVNSTNNATSARPVNQRPINPFGRIVYTSANTNYTAGSNLAATTIWSQYTFVLGYSFNRTGEALELTVEKPVYIKCAPQSNGSAIIDADTPYVQALPSTADGKIYIFLGVAYDATHVELYAEHPVYWHDGTGIRLWNGSATAAIDIDTALSTISENPVQNKVITNALAGKIDASSLPTGTEGQVLSINSAGNWAFDDLYLMLNYEPPYVFEIVNDGENSVGEISVHIDASITTISNVVNSCRKVAFVLNDDGKMMSFSPEFLDSNNGQMILTNSGGFYSNARIDFHPDATGNIMEGTLGTIDTGEDKANISDLPVAATATPIVDGTGAVGTSAKYAREDHVHPKATYTASEVGLGNVDNVRQYSASNPPPYPVTSVNGETGAVTLSIPTKTSDLTNDSGYTTNVGTITGVTAGSGLSGGGSSGSVTLNHSNSVTAQNTQALYPVKIDAQGHISAYGTAVTSLPASDVSAWAKASTKPTYTASEVGALPDTTVIPSKTSDLTNDSGFITGMFIGSYGHSTYAEILAAYQANKVVYCRASSAADPASGSQTRMAFLAYVNNAETPTTFEFQYYRSVSTHTESQQGDQVYIYTLTSAGTWTVTVRNAFSAVAAGTGLSRSYSNGTVTLSVSSSLPAVTSSDNGKVLTVVNGAWAAASLPIYDGSAT